MGYRDMGVYGVWIGMCIGRMWLCVIRSFVSFIH